MSSHALNPCLLYFCEDSASLPGTQALEMQSSFQGGSQAWHSLTEGRSCVPVILRFFWYLLNPFDSLSNIFKRSGRHLSTSFVQAPKRHREPMAWKCERISQASPTGWEFHSVWLRDILASSKTVACFGYVNWVFSGHCYLCFGHWWPFFLQKLGSLAQICPPALCRLPSCTENQSLGSVEQFRRQVLQVENCISFDLQILTVFSIFQSFSELPTDACSRASQIFCWLGYLL